MSTYVYQINGQEILAKRAECTRTGRNIDNELDALKRDIDGIGAFEIVDSMTGDPPHPDVAKPSHKVIYLYREPQSQDKDPYQEWVYTQSNTWECIGETSIDLTPYATTASVEAIIESLDASVSSSDGTNVNVQIVEVNGKITSVSIIRDTTVNATTYANDKAAIEEDISEIQGNMAHRVTTAGWEAGNFASLSSNGDLADSGYEAADFAGKGEFDTAIQTVENEIDALEDGKMDKVPGAQSGNIAVFGNSGNVVDGLSKISDLATKSEFNAYKTSNDAEVAKKANKDTNATAGNFAKFVAGGDIADSSYNENSFATAAQGAKADTAIQGVKCYTDAELTPDANKKITLPQASAQVYGVVTVGYTTINDDEENNNG